MRPDQPWTPKMLQELREKAGFTSQRQLALKSGADQQTINRIEAGGTMSIETSKKLAPLLNIDHPALFIAHNLAVTTGELVRGYLSLNQAKRDRNYIESMLQQTTHLPPEQFRACQTTLGKLNEVISELQAVRHKHSADWPGADSPEVEEEEVSGEVNEPARRNAMATTN